MDGVWIVRIRECHKNARRHNKNHYTNLKFDYASGVREFLKSLVDYAMDPIEIKMFYNKKGEA